LRYYTATEAAAILGVTPKTLVGWLKKGEIRVRKKGRAYRLREDQLEEIRRKMTKKREKVLDEGKLSEKSGNQDTISAQLNKLSGDIGELRGAMGQIVERLNHLENRLESRFNGVLWVLMGLWGTIVAGFIALRVKR